MKLPPFQKKLVTGALTKNVSTAVLLIGRGNAKAVLSAGIALGALFGEWDEQPRRGILFAVRLQIQEIIGRLDTMTPVSPSSLPNRGIPGDGI